jgi:transcription antitermination factor NusA-like protein
MDLLDKVLSCKIVDYLIIKDVDKITSMRGHLGFIVSLIKRENNKITVIAWSENSEKIRNA